MIDSQGESEEKRGVEEVQPHCTGGEAASTLEPFCLSTVTNVVI